MAHSPPGQTRPGHGAPGREGTRQDPDPQCRLHGPRRPLPPPGNGAAPRPEPASRGHTCERLPALRRLRVLATAWTRRAELRGQRAGTRHAEPTASHHAPRPPVAIGAHAPYHLLFKNSCSERGETHVNVTAWAVSKRTVRWHQVRSQRHAAVTMALSRTRSSSQMTLSPGNARPRPCPRPPTPRPCP